jgi:hypothetical protein
VTPLDGTATLTDVAFAVCTALERAGEYAVLVGGSAATYYAPEAYESRESRWSKPPIRPLKPNAWGGVDAGMRQRTLIGLGLIAVGLGFVAGSSRRGPYGRRFFAGPLFEEPLIPEPFFGGPPFGEPWFGEPHAAAPKTRAEFEAVPLLVLRGAFNGVTIVAGDGPQIVVSCPAAANGVDGFFSRRVETDDRAGVVVDVHPRTAIHVTVPRGTAVQLKFDKSRIAVTGVDDVDVHSVKGRLVLRDLAGAVRINSVMDSVLTELSHERETRSVEVSAVKSTFSLAVPAARGGDYRITAANSGVTAPPSAEGGIPVTVRAARSKIAITAD